MPCVDTVQGFYFALLQYSHIQAFTARFAVSIQLYRPRHKTSHRALQALFLRFAPIYCLQYQIYISGYNTTCATLERITAPQHLRNISDTNATPDTTQVSTDRPIIIRYIRVQHTADHASPAGQSSNAEPLTALAASLFGLSPDS